MRNLRGRPRNISDTGIVYLESDGEDSDYADSDVEPVFFPAAEFELGEVLDEFIGENEDNDEVDNEVPANGGRFFRLIDSDDDGSDIEAIPEENAPPDLQRSVIQYFGGTVQVRHIVHDNFNQLQQQQQNPAGSDPAGDAAHSSQGASGSSQDRRGSEESEGEAPSICESEIVIRVQVDESEGGQAMADQVDCVVRTGGENACGSTTCEGGGDDKPVKTSASSEEEPAKVSGGCSSGLVPYPDLPDYASAGEEEDDDNLKASIPAPYKSPGVASSSPSTSRSSLKRKEPDFEEDGEVEETNGLEKSSRKRLEEVDEEEEATCNPMVSDEECDESEEAFRGDRIGSTVYSERHVLKILMQWIEELPQYSIDNLLKSRENDQSDEDIEKKIQRLKTEFEEQMSLLWDMSSETDVMRFLVENKIFSFIRDTIDRSACNRLTEIALGIFANVISEPSIIEDFTIHDSSIQLVERVVELCTKVSDVSVLIQVFSVLRRIVWYLRTVAPVKKWTDLLQSASFLGCVNFIMSSSRNVLLLGNVIMLVFTLLDFLNPDGDEVDDQAQEDPEEAGESIETYKAPSKQQLTKNYEPFCQSEFVPSVCEALKELMKNPKPANSRPKLTSTREKLPVPSSSNSCPTDDHCPTADDMDIPIPEGHVQQAILKGISTLALLQKAPNGQEVLKRNAHQVVPVLLDFYGIFITCMEEVTRSNSLEYFALSLHLLSFCHTSLNEIIPDAITHPISTASKLMSQEERDKEVDMVIRVQLKDGVEFDSVTYIALVAHEYLASVAEKFGHDSTLNARNSAVHDKFFAVYDQVMARFNEESEATETDKS